MRKPIIFMFSGQGSQYYQMGRELFEKHPVFKDTFLHLDGIVQDLIGHSIVDELYIENHRLQDPFHRTLFTHPAIFMVEYALARVLLEEGIEPDYVLGTSLGEYTAAAVAAVLTPEEMLTCIIRQAQLVEAFCIPGSMMAILYNSRLFHEMPETYRGSELAAIHFHSNFVISGMKRTLREIERQLVARNIVCQVLPISYAFHSSFMDPIEKEYKRILHSKGYNKPRFPLISCVEGSIKEDFTADDLWKVARQPIQFNRALQAVQQRCDEPIYLDLGPRGSLSNFIKHQQGPSSSVFAYPIMTPFAQEIHHIENVKTIYHLNKRQEVRQEVYA